MYLMRGGLSVVIVTSLVLMGGVPSARSQPATASPVKVAAAKMAVRDLYVNHIFWVRSLVISTRLGEKSAISEADEYGEKNAQAIGHSIAPFYGQAAGEKFATLFVGHYTAVKGYMNAAFANRYKGNETMKRAAVAQLTKNADEIATFVSAANPNLPKAAVYGLLTAHIGHHIGAIDATAKKDWSHEADVWDPMLTHIYKLSDALVDGIAKQFPEKFQ